MEITDRNGVRTVTFDRPDALNALTTESAAELADVLSQADSNELDAIVLTGAARRPPGASHQDDQHGQAGDPRQPGPRGEETLDYESLVQSQAFGGDEHRKGVSAFLEERDPAFQS